MCGISGILNLDGAPASRSQLAAMIATLNHRGPDARGIDVVGPLGFAHARLSIIDLAGGAQPMATADGRLRVTFNGEIFNYVELREELQCKGHHFTTRSDTEVILHAYREFGEDCVHRFNGQWAFAIWDSTERKLFLSRDRCGIRPLFYTQTRNSFLFASEIKALLACDEVTPEIDLEGLDQIFTFWVTLAPRTAFKGIAQLPPGCSLTIKDGVIATRQYWAVNYAVSDHGRDSGEDQLAEELLSLLADATRIRLRSDVPVGTYLSGGIDSTAITALVRQIAHDRLRSFSVTFDDPEYDEARYQQEASEYLGTRHSNICCGQVDIARIFPDVVRHTEQPVIRTAPAPMYLLSALVRDSGFKVVLTGEGADEVLGGYDIFKEAKIRRFWAQQPDSSIRPLLLRRLYPYMEAIQRQPAAYLKQFFRVTPKDLASPFFSHLPRWSLTAQIKRFYSPEMRDAMKAHDPLITLQESLPSDYASWSYFGQAEHLESRHLLPGYILSSQGDRMAMAHSVEGRYPFLDYRVVEFAAQLPANKKMKALNQKYLLKKAVGNLIPQSIVRRPKQPYRAPEGKCFVGSHAPDYAEELLSREAIRQSGIFDPNSVNALVNKVQSGRACSVKDNMAMIAVLSTQLLIHQFIT